MFAKTMSNKGLRLAQLDTTAACPQRKIQQIYSYSESGHSIVLETLLCWTQLCLGHSNTKPIKVR